MAVRTRAEYTALVDSLIVDNGTGLVDAGDVRSLLTDLADSADWRADRVRDFRFAGQFKLGDDEVVGFQVRGWFEDIHASAIATTSATATTVIQYAGGPRWTRVPVELQELRLSTRCSLSGGGIDWAPAVYDVDRLGFATVGPTSYTSSVILHPGIGGDWISAPNDLSNEYVFDLGGYVLERDHQLCFGVACPDNSPGGATTRYLQMYEASFRYREMWETL